MQSSNMPPIIVIGMHRSGTSLTAELLSEMGVFMGKELDFAHEALYFQNINKKLLAACGAYWASPHPFILANNNKDNVEGYVLFVKDLLSKNLEGYGKPGQFKAWGWKDPRNTITIPIWLRLFPKAKVIHVIRNGIDVAMSLHRREILRYCQGNIKKRLLPPTIGKAYRLWELYVRTGLLHAKTHPNWHTIYYENLVANPERELKKLAEFAEIEASPLKIKQIAENKIIWPNKKSWLTNVRLRFLMRMGIIKPHLIKEIGYAWKLD